MSGGAIHLPHERIFCVSALRALHSRLMLSGEAKHIDGMMDEILEFWRCDDISALEHINWNQILIKSGLPELEVTSSFNRHLFLS
jgi:hypothetical protein